MPPLQPYFLLRPLGTALDSCHLTNPLAPAIRREESCTNLDAPIPERRFSQVAWCSGRVAEPKAVALGSSQWMQRVYVALYRPRESMRQKSLLFPLLLRMLEKLKLDSLRVWGTSWQVTVLTSQDQHSIKKWVMAEYFSIRREEKTGEEPWAKHLIQHPWGSRAQSPAQKLDSQSQMHDLWLPWGKSIHQFFDCEFSCWKLANRQEQQQNTGKPCPLGSWDYWVELGVGCLSRSVKKNAKIVCFFLSPFFSVFTFLLFHPERPAKCHHHHETSSYLWVKL